MKTRSRDRGFYDPPRELSRLSERMLGALVGPAESTPQLPIAARP
jgi:hypothetical protein